MSWRWLIGLTLLAVLAVVPLSWEPTRLRIGSKTFTESVILSDIAALLARDAGTEVLHQRELGGTRILFDALASGQIALYPEYTGTITNEILPDSDLVTLADIREKLAGFGISVTDPLGFNNSYAIAMRPEEADALGISTISDLRKHPGLKLRFSNEFMNRADGWPSLQQHYSLPQTDVTGVVHDIAYRQLDQELISGVDVYTTDAKIRYYDLRVLEDDLNFFPKYDAVILYRTSLGESHPDVVAALKRLEGAIDSRTMIALNGETELLQEPEPQVAAGFLKENLDVAVEVEAETAAQRIGKHTLEHLDLVRKSLLAAIIVAIPLGIISHRHAAVGHVVIGAVGIIQTIPALALLVMLMEPTNWLGLSSIGSGSATAVIALFLYSLLPIVRNTYTGLQAIPASARESAMAIGLPRRARLWRVELPMASPTILAGIKTAAVINVGFATLGALIGAGGYGQPILTGIRLANNSLILQGAIPAAVLALLIQALFDLAERTLVSPGLRLREEG